MPYFTAPKSEVSIELLATSLKLSLMKELFCEARDAPSTALWTFRHLLLDYVEL